MIPRRLRVRAKSQEPFAAHEFLAGPHSRRPPQYVLEAMRRRGDEVYAEYFGTPKKVPEPVAT
jgi:hypothetical protein